MKKITLFVAFILSSTMLFAQDTFNVSWLQGTTDANVTLEVGDTVEWTWGNTAPHNVESTDPDAPGDFSSGTETGMGFVYSYTFMSVAEIDYLCTIHPGSMFGRLTITEELGVDDKFATNINYYPNPVSNTLTVSSLFELDSFVIHNVLGKVITQGSASGNITEIDMSDLSRGMYLVTAKSGGLSTTFQVVKR
ncbi:T9SS type A sorting domain-containing protein [Jejudonia soesokkakensis]|uniref:T9SS type A sorting domain-containing protein n=1 Tax=Jejudonia soesokkakensis TaxID=1323432 RepID=A0ABW2N0T5_9FLAO